MPRTAPPCAVGPVTIASDHGRFPVVTPTLTDETFASDDYITHSLLDFQRHNNYK